MPRWDVFWVREFRQVHDLDEDDVRLLYNEGRLQIDDCIRPVGTEQWLRVKDVSILSDYIRPTVESTSHRSKSETNQGAAEPSGPRPNAQAVHPTQQTSASSNGAKTEPRPFAVTPAASRKSSVRPSEPREKPPAPRSPIPADQGDAARRPKEPARKLIVAATHEPNSASKTPKISSPPPPPSAPAAMSGKIAVVCPSCGKTGRIAAAKQGQTIDCPDCGGAVKVEGPVVACPSSARKKKSKDDEPMGLLEAGSAGAFAAGVGLSIAFVCLGCFAWAYFDRSTGYHTELWILPIMAGAGLGMILGYRGQNTLAGAVSAFVAFFGTLLGRSLIGAVLLVNELEPELLTTDDHATVIEAEVDNILTERKLDVEQASLEEFDSAEAEAKLRVAKLSADEVHNRAVGIRFADYDREELIDELVNHELGLDDELAELEQNPERIQSTREAHEKLDDGQLKAKFAVMEEANLREQVAVSMTQREIEKQGLDWDDLPQEQYQQIHSESKRRVADWSVAQLLEAECQGLKKEVEQARRGLLVFAALYEMFFSFGLGGWATLLVGVGVAYKVGCGDWMMR